MGQADAPQAGEQAWDFPARLPASVGSYRLGAGASRGRDEHIAAYVDALGRRRLDMLYAGETCDYLLVKTVGLNVFRLTDYIFRDRDKFAAEVLAHLEEILTEEQPHAMQVEAAALAFGHWDYWRELPRRVGDFELFITPERPLEYLNGSYIFLDYSDFQHGNQIYFAYNILRNEIFAEKKQAYLPLTTDLFDVPRSVPDGRKLERLGALLQERLTDTLQELARGGH